MQTMRREFVNRIEEYLIARLRQGLNPREEAENIYDVIFSRKKPMPSSRMALIEEDWKQGMMMVSVPWDKNKKDWQFFPNWLLEQEEKGYSVKKFCEWFMADPFRKKTIAMWSPDGRPSDGAYSFKMVWLQAFEEPEETELSKENYTGIFDDYINDKEEKESICIYTELLGTFKDLQGNVREKRSRFCGKVIPFGKKYCEKHERMLEHDTL